MRVIVTRPAAQAMAWVADLRRAGVDAVALPLIDIAPPADPAPVQTAWRALPGVALVFFVSANAVQHFFALRPAGGAWPAGTQAGAPGPGTASALRAQGLPAGAVVEPADDAPSYDSAALWARLKDQDWVGREVMIVRGEQGRDWLADQLSAVGATLRNVAAYARQAPVLSPAGLQLMAAAHDQPGRHLWLFSSSEAIRHLAALWSGGVPAGARAVATHPRIAEAARSAGFAEVRLTQPAPVAVLQAIRGASIQSNMP